MTRETTALLRQRHQYDGLFILAIFTFVLVLMGSCAVEKLRFRVDALEKQQHALKELSK